MTQSRLSPLVGLVAITFLSLPVDALTKEIFSNNAICRKNRCINPLFPGLMDLGELDKVKWVTTTQSTVEPFLNFCKDVIKYPPALPSPSSATGAPLTELVAKQEKAATTTYFYHLSAMGLEPWDFKEPALLQDECAQSVWKMACYTYFPRVQPGARQGEESPYMRPCASCCVNFLSACSVECCDESAQCVFDHTFMPKGSNTSLTQTGYVSQSGPSALCTGTAGRVAPHLALAAALFGLASLTLGSAA